jgi:Protein of unknown function (DUF5661)
LVVCAFPVISAVDAQAATTATQSVTQSVKTVTEPAKTVTQTVDHTVTQSAKTVTQTVNHTVTQTVQVAAAAPPATTATSSGATGASPAAAAAAGAAAGTAAAQNSKPEESESPPWWAWLLIALAVAAALAGGYFWGRRNGREEGEPYTAPAPPGSPHTSFTTAEAQEAGVAIGIDWARVPFDVEQLRAGMDVELEHGLHDGATNVTNDDPLFTAKIVLAHLNEFSDYYTRLQRMEAEAERERQVAREAAGSAGGRPGVDGPA